MATNNEDYIDILLKQKNLKICGREYFERICKNAPSVRIRLYSALRELLYVAFEYRLVDCIDSYPLQENQRTLDNSASIDWLYLSRRAFNCLSKAGIKTVRQLTQLTEEDLLNIKNLGRGTLSEIIEKLKDSDLSLRAS